MRRYARGREVAKGEEEKVGALLTSAVCLSVWLESRGSGAIGRNNVRRQYKVKTDKNQPQDEGKARGTAAWRGPWRRCNPGGLNAPTLWAFVESFHLQEKTITL